MFFFAMEIVLFSVSSLLLLSDNATNNDFDDLQELMSINLLAKGYQYSHHECHKQSLVPCGVKISSIKQGYCSKVHLSAFR